MSEYKHLPGKHNQKTHGRSTATRRAAREAYTQARTGGASIEEARGKAREASQQARTSEREREAQRRTDALRTHAERARGAANSGQVTESQRLRLLEKADRLEARAAEGPKPRRVPTMAVVGYTPQARDYEPYGSRVETRLVRRRTSEFDDAAREMIADLNQAWGRPTQPRPLRLAENYGQRAMTPDGVVRAKGGEILAYFHNDVVSIRALADKNGNVYPHLDVMGLEGLSYTVRGRDGSKIDYEIAPDGELYVHK